ncbi:MAG: altronate dehydratase small subunit [Clostridia bacterium]|jgi:altronate dehydratase small subunit|nr:D-galactarate dehydratase [Clostridiales bacterium]MDK2986548.1 altronate dehydratase small subunit [Clostridia bacterium]
MARAIVMKKNDNVATMMCNVKSGETVNVIGPDFELEIEARNDISFGHKISIRDIKEGENIIKYGESIGSAVMNISQGEHVHLHNLMSNRGRGDLVKSS